MKVLKKKTASNSTVSCDVMIYDVFFILHAITEVSLSFGNISKKFISIITSSNAHTDKIAYDSLFTPSIIDHEHFLKGRIEGENYCINSPDQVRPANRANE